jgi:hypothetical protein
VYSKHHGFLLAEEEPYWVAVAAVEEELDKVVKDKCRPGLKPRIKATGQAHMKKNHYTNVTRHSHYLQQYRQASSR